MPFEFEEVRLVHAILILQKILQNITYTNSLRFGCWCFSSIMFLLFSSSRKKEDTKRKERTVLHAITEGRSQTRHLKKASLHVAESYKDHL